MSRNKKRYNKAQDQTQKCPKKIRYYYIKETYNEIKRLEKINYPRKYEPYWCWVCAYYHIGSMIRKNRRIVR